MNPLNVLQLASSMGPLKRVLLVGCEPQSFGPDEGQMGLSEPIEAALDDAVKMVESLIEKLLTEDTSVTKPEKPKQEREPNSRSRGDCHGDATV